MTMLVSAPPAYFDPPDSLSQILGSVGVTIAITVNVKL